MRLAWITLGCTVLAVGSGIGIASICKGGGGEASRVTCPFIKGSENACPVAGERPAENICPFVSGAASHCPRDRRGSAKDSCPFVGEEKKGCPRVRGRGGRPREDAAAWL